MQVKISDLRALIEQLLSHLEENGHSCVELSGDYYWDIPREYRYDPHKEPKDLNLGQLTDDWTELLKISEGKSEPLGYALVWLSSILRVVGEEIVD
jgi:hypothetical protein